MTRFESPAFRQPGGHVPAPVMRGLLAVASVAFTAAIWVGVGAQAGQTGEPDTAVHVALPPVVIAGRRLPPEDLTAALGAGPLAVNCLKDTFPHEGASPKRVNLNQ